jgi:integrase
VRGHVRRRGKGWVYVLDAGRDPATGKRRQRWSRQFPKQRDAEGELRRALGRVDSGGDVLPERVTVNELAARWYDHMDTMGEPAAKVREGYRRTIDVAVLPRIGSVELTKLRRGEVQSVLNTYAETHKPRTVARLRAVLSGMFNFALRQELITTNPTTATTTPAASKPKLTVPEMEQVLGIIDAARGGSYEIPILLAAVTGARRSEVLGLGWRSVDLDAGTVRIERTLQRVGKDLVFSDATKTKHSLRTIPLVGDVVARLRQHKTDQARRRLMAGAAWHDHDLVCERGNGRPIDPDALTQAFKRVARSVGVNCRLHDLRHALATRLAHSGLHSTETSALLGHASASFTANVYQHTDAASVERTRGAVEAAFGGS